MTLWTGMRQRPWVSWPRGAGPSPVSIPEPLGQSRQVGVGQAPTQQTLLSACFKNQAARWPQPVSIKLA